MHRLDHDMGAVVISLAGSLPLEMQRLDEVAQKFLEDQLVPGTAAQGFRHFLVGKLIGGLMDMRTEGHGSPGPPPAPSAPVAG